MSITPPSGSSTPGRLALRVTSPHTAKLTSAAAQAKATPVTSAKLGGRPMRMLPSHWLL